MEIRLGFAKVERTALYSWRAVLVVFSVEDSVLVVETLAVSSKSLKADRMIIQFAADQFQ